jgi:hypothetical protein
MQICRADNLKAATVNSDLGWRLSMVNIADRPTQSYRANRRRSRQYDADGSRMKAKRHRRPDWIGSRNYDLLRANRDL